MTIVRLSLVAPIETRDGSLAKDSGMVNVYVDNNVTGAPEVVKRPGSVTLYSAGAATIGQGMVAFNGTACFIAGDNLYTVASGFQVALPAPTVSNARLTTLDSVQSVSILKSKWNLWKMTGLTTLAKCVSANYPTLTLPGIVYLDGYYYVLSTTGALQNSSFEDPLTWDPLGFLMIDPGLGTAIALARHLNYVFAFCTNGTQAFYNAGNASPGSPLSPAGNAVFSTGCAHADSIINISGNTIFMTHSRQYGRGVAMFVGLSIEILSTPYVNKILNLSTLASGISGMGIKVSGHSFYLLTLFDLNVTLCFDFDTRIWTTWASSPDGTANNYFEGLFALPQSETGAQNLFLNAAGNKVISMNPAYFDDSGLAIVAQITSPTMDNGMMDKKFCSALYVVGDTVPASTVAISYSDDDCQTYNSARTVDMSTTRKMLRVLGSFRRRVWRLRHTASTSFRAQSLEVEVDKGSS